MKILIREVIARHEIIKSEICDTFFNKLIFLDIDDYESLQESKQNYFIQMIKKIKEIKNEREKTKNDFKKIIVDKFILCKDINNEIMSFY
jgi:hypothetical protein